MNITKKQESENRKKIINSAVKICVECESLSVLIDGRDIFCKDCNSQFRIKDDYN